MSGRGNGDRRARNGHDGLASTERHGRTIQLGVRFHDDQLDLGAPGPSVGDELVMNDTLVNRRARTVGSDAGVCTFTSVAPPVASCVLTFVLRNGQIATQFRNTPPPRKLVAIVGGAGAYRGASGTAGARRGPEPDRHGHLPPRALARGAASQQRHGSRFGGRYAARPGDAGLPRAS